uniref:Putative nucleic-acid-binding protein implicated in transcription termination n=1 Tax=Eubacterium cellulosolvens (strain ATCC 43171 / JCM 9499 / 6) TaxID=633697 RepID=I5AVE7_EUBC6
MAAVRKVPMRKCVGCNEKKEKKELIRILRTPEGEVVLDESGRSNGRGAYICRDADCLAKARKNRGLGRSLGIEIPDEVYERLEKEMSGLEQ